MSRLRSAKSASARRTMKASRPWLNRLKPDRPGCSSALRPKNRPSLVDVKSSNAVEAIRALPARVPMPRPVTSWASQVRAENGNPSKARSRPGLRIFELQSFKPVEPPKSCHAGPPPQVRHGHARSAQDSSEKTLQWHPKAHLRCRNNQKSSRRRRTSHEQVRAPTRTEHNTSTARQVLRDRLPSNSARLSCPQAGGHSNACCR